MIKKKSKSLLSLLLSLTMLVTLVATPVYASDGTEASATGKTTGASVKIQDVNEKEEPELDYGIAVIDEDASSTAVAKVGDTSYTSLSAAISAASAGDTVTLLANVSESSVTVSKNLTIDLSGYTLTTSYVYVGTSGVEVTVKNGTITGTYGAYVTAGTLTLDSCTLSLTDAAYAYGGELKLVSTTLTSTTSNRAINCYDSSTVTIGAGSTVNCASGTGVVIWGDGSGESAKTPTLNVYGNINAITCISGNGTDYSGTKINLYSGAVLTATLLGMYLPQPCTVNITGATVTGLAAIGIKSGTLTISGDALIQGTGGSYDSELESTTNGINIDGSAIIVDSYTGYAGEVTITIQADDDGNTPTITSENAVAIREISNSSSTNVVSITISAGTVTSGDTLDAISVTEAAEDYVSVTGGTFSSDVSTYTTTTSTAVANSDGTYSVVTTVENAVALVYDADGNYVSSYDSLSSAYTAVKKYSGGTIYLADNISNEKIKVTGDVVFTLDLNGYTFDSGSNVAVLVQSSGAAVTIKDGSNGNGIITSSATTAVIYSTAGTITIEGGTITGTASSTFLIRTGGENAGIIVEDGTFSGYYIFRVDAGSVTVNSGTFTSNDSGSVVYDVASDASLTINDGWFNSSSAFRTSGAKITVYGGYFTVSEANLSRLKNYISTGYTVITETVDETYWYTVGKASFTVEYKNDGGETAIRSSHTTLSAALSAAENGDTIVMNADSESGIKLNDSSKSLTLDLNGYKISENDADSYVVGVVSGALTIIDSSEDGTGTITGSISESSSSSITGIVRNMGGTLTIESGTISIDSGNAVNAYSGTNTITGGYINGSVTANDTLSITGGYFTSDPSDYTAEGYVAAAITDDTYKYTVISVALGVSDSNLTEVTATSIDGYGTNTLYVGVSASDISSNYSTEKYPTTNLTYTSDSSVDSGSYIFAGWYTLNEDGNYTAMNVFPKSDDDTTGATAYYAKFVDKNALKVYCVYTPMDATNGPSHNAWRFISSLESGNPQALLFKIGDTVEQVKTIQPYSTVQSVNKTYYPSDFSTVSTYVASYGFLDSTNSVTSYTVQCGWLTLDGTMVYGSAYTFDASSCTAATALDGTVTE